MAPVDDRGHFVVALHSIGSSASQPIPVATLGINLGGTGRRYHRRDRDREPSNVRPTPRRHLALQFNESAMSNLVSRFLAAESGATTAKYGLIAAVISAAIVTAGLGIITKLAAGTGPLGP